MKFSGLFLLSSLVYGSLIPAYSQNDITVIGDAVFTPEEISAGVDVIFLVRFHNTGADTAFNVVVRDTLDPRFNSSTLEVLDASHGYQFLMDQGYARWYFNGIRLPGDAAEDFGESGSSGSGYIMFKIQPHRFLDAGQIIQNRACITFDDETVCTNNATIWIDEGASAGEPQKGARDYKIVPNPNQGQFVVEKIGVTEHPEGAPVEWWITDINGSVVYDGRASDATSTTQQVLLERPTPGFYLLWIKEDSKLAVEQFAVTH